jgi:hypothetical protein
MLYPVQLITKVVHMYNNRYLDIINRPVFHSRHNVSDNGFCAVFRFNLLR